MEHRFLATCKNLSSTARWPQPTSYLPDPTQHTGTVSTADRELVEIQCLMEEGDAVTFRKSLFFCRKQPRISPSDVTCVLLWIRYAVRGDFNMYRILSARKVRIPLSRNFLGICFW
jgi:hypothetical protein